MPQNVCAKKVMRPKKHVLQRRVNFPNFPTLFKSILPHVQSNGGKIEVQNFVFLTSELKSVHNLSLENMFCSYFWDTLYFHTFGSQIGVRSQTLYILAKTIKYKEQNRMSDLAEIWEIRLVCLSLCNGPTLVSNRTT